MRSIVFSKVGVVWLVLVAATIVSWALGAGSSFDRTGQEAASVVILVVAFIKVRFIGLYFMELRDAPRVLRMLFEMYCAVVCAVTIAIFLLV